MKYYTGDEVVVRCNNLVKCVNKIGVITKVKRFRTSGDCILKKNYSVIYIELEDGKRISLKDKGRRVGFKRYKIIDVLK